MSLIKNKNLHLKTLDNKPGSMSAVHDKSLAFLIHKEVFQIPKMDISQTKNKNM